MRAPSDSEILQAEQRVADARRELSAAGTRTNVAFHDALVKPGTLLGVAGAAGLLGYYVFKEPGNAPRRRKGSTEAPSTTTTAATAAVASTSMAGIVMAFVMRYVMQQLPGIGMGMVKQAMRHNARGAASGGASPGVVRPSVTVH